MASGDPQEIYKERLDARTLSLAELGAKRHRFGILRLLIFAVAAALGWFAVQGKLPSWPVAIPIALFVALVCWQSRVEREMECARRAIAFYERGLARIEHRWHGGG